MREDEAASQDGSARITRRQALKHGAVLGGAALWTVPALQVLSITEAAAQQPSGMPPGHGAGNAVQKGSPRGRFF